MRGLAARAPSANGLAMAQSLGVVVAWLIVVIPHAGDDGLWFIGDAARHALNGLFWSDFVRALPSDPREYVLRYYARYPAITPASYPPAFYLLEAAAYQLIAPSPFVAKGLVLAHTLVAGLIVSLWLRRYVSLAAGWGGMLFVLQPGVVVWSNAVMLNIPATALAVLTLYCARRWMDALDTRHLLLTGFFAAWTALTYFPAALVAIVALLWLAGDGRWRRLWQRHRFVVAIAIAAPLAVGLLAIDRIPFPFALAYVSLSQLWYADKWLYYLYALPKLVSPWILFLVLCAPLASSRWRPEVRWLGVWVVVTYVGLSYFWSRDGRYALLIAPAIVMLAVIGMAAVAAHLERLVHMPAARSFAAALVLLIAVQGFVAARQRFPKSDGMKAVADFVVREAPTERVLYDGRSDGAFAFYVRAQDPDFRHGIVRGSKLLYASAIMPTLGLTEHVASVADVIRMLEKDCGCAWILIERLKKAEPFDASRLLRDAVQGPQFRLVRTFPVATDAATDVDVYEFLNRFDTPTDLALPFPILGKGVTYRARPIER